jgi:serine O-acetyltransferase
MSRDNQAGFWSLVRADARRHFKPSPQQRPLRMWINVLLFVPGFQLTFLFRLQAMVVKIPVFGKLFRKILWYIGWLISAAEIDVSTVIGEGLYIPHATGIVIRGDCIIGKNVTILQGVTIGRNEAAYDGRTIIGDNCKFFAGAKVIGDLVIGDDVTVGANAVVLKDLPSGVTAVGVPARVLPAK